MKFYIVLSTVSSLFLSQNAYAEPSNENSLSVSAPANGVAQKEPLVTVYSSDHCSWCKSSMELLDAKNIKYRVIDVRGRKDLMDQMEKITGARTVPQIIIKGKHIGGYMSLVGLNLAGDLDNLAKEDANQSNPEENGVKVQNVSNADTSNTTGR